MKKIVVILSLLLVCACVLCACEGKSAYEIAVENGFTGTEAEWLESLKGDKGDTGAQGPQGEKGDVGEKGEENPQGLDFYLLPDDTYGVKSGKALYLERIEIPCAYNGKAVTKILPNAFCDLNAQNAALKEITIPSSVKIIDNFAFSNCTSLTKIDIKENSQMVSIGKGAFMGCKSLTTFDFPDSVTAIGVSAFEGCVVLESVSLPSSLATIGDLAFCDCILLKDVIIPNSVTSIGVGAFKNCQEIQSITIPAKVAEIGNEAFSGCLKLKTIYYNASNVTIKNAGYPGVFYKCGSIDDEGVSVRFGVNVIALPALFFIASAVKAFNVKSITFDEGGVLEKIGPSAFYSCYSKNGSLSITIPASVKTVYLYGMSAFDSIAFVNPDGWYGKNMLEEEGVAVDLTDPVANAEGLEYIILDRA